MYLNLYPAKEVQLFPGLGIYSGILALYIKLQCILVSKGAKTTSIVFYALCLLYVLSTASVACDLLQFVIQVSNNSICKYIIFYQLCRCVLMLHYNLKLTYSQWYFAL